LNAGPTVLPHSLGAARRRRRVHRPGARARGVRAAAGPRVGTERWTSERSGQASSIGRRRRRVAVADEPIDGLGRTWSTGVWRNPSARTAFSTLNYIRLRAMRGALPSEHNQDWHRNDPT